MRISRARGLVRATAAAAGVGVLIAAMVVPASGRDRPFGTSRLFLDKWAPMRAELDMASPGGQSKTDSFSKTQIESARCTASGTPAAWVDISCNTAAFGQNFSPDNELAIAVNPNDPMHLLAGSNDYYYRFNNSTGARQAIVPTGFFTSFDGGATWLDGQIPMRSGNGAGDPSPAFVGRDSPDAHHATALMAQLENTGGNGGPFVAQGDVSVSRSTDGGVTWGEPVTVFKGLGTGIGPANQAVFWDKEWLTVDNSPTSPSYGRAVVTTTKFVNGLQGSYASSAIWMSYSDDGGVHWSAPVEISGKNPAVCTFQSSGPDDGSCDEDQFSIPEFGPDGTLFVHFINGQREASWEVPFDFDSTIMVVKAPPTAGVPSFSAPVAVVDIEDGLSDMPFSVIGRQTVWGHQIRWTAVGTISVDPTDPSDVTVVWADRGTANPNATDGCFAVPSGPAYDPCGAGPGSDLDVFMSRSVDGGATWSPRTLLHDGGGHAQWFVWADHKPDGTLVAAWDQDDAAAPADTFHHVLWTEGGGMQTLGPAEHPDVSVTHWAGQYTTAWPVVCGPAAATDPPIANAEGKDCNVFHGDYTGLAAGSDGSVNVVWTGLNRWAVAPQTDAYTGMMHDGYAQDAMFARR